jgi:hypothetical protein
MGVQIPTTISKGGAFGPLNWSVSQLEFEGTLPVLASSFSLSLSLSLHFTNETPTKTWTTINP